MNTHDSKVFIVANSKNYLFNVNDKWKRSKKYKQDDLSVREFTSTSGDIVLISESQNGMKDFLSIKLNVTPLSENALTFLSKDKLITELDNFINDCNLNEKMNIKGDNVWYPQKAIYFLSTELNNRICFDFENTKLTYKCTDNVSYVLMEAGGDWEFPVYSYFYWSEKEQQLKGFFPVGEGNSYNIETGTTYGSENEDDEGINQKYITDMKNLNIEKIERLGFSQFLQHIQREYENI